MPIGRRSLFALGGAAFVASGGARGAELNPSQPGITVQIRYFHREWQVCVPDLDGFENMPPIEGFMAAVRWIPLVEFLAALDGTA